MAGNIKGQGNGKVRLIAKNGRYADTNFTKKLREIRDNAPTESRRKGAIDALSDTTGKYNSTDEGKKDAAEGSGSYGVEFDVTPDITESASAIYMEESGLRAPASLLFYSGSPSRTFSINAKLIARNVSEAKKVVEQIHILKSWRMPESYGGLGIMEKPPAILLLQGYGKMFKDIQVVMTDLTIEFSSEFDYIVASTTEFQQGTPTTQPNYTPTAEDGLDDAMSDAEWDAKYMNPNAAASSDSTLKDLETVKTRGTRSVELTSAVPIIVPVSISLREVHNVDYMDLQAGAGDELLTGLGKFDILQYRLGELHSW